MFVTYLLRTEEPRAAEDDEPEDTVVPKSVD